MTADPNAANAHLDRGNVLMAQERFDEAIGEYREADELWQKDRSQQRKRALYGWGRALRLQKRNDEAAGKYREALGIDPEYPWAYYGLGRVLADQERFDEAIEQYHKADELWQKDRSQQRQRVLLNWRRALRLKERYEQAAEKYRETIGIDPECPWAYYGLGRVLVGQGHFDDAIEQYRKADELWQKTGSKDRKFALRAWADALRLQEHYDEAVRKYQEAIGIDPGYPAAYNNFGNALLDQERFDEAIEQYRKADELWQKTGSKDRKFALSNWARALRSKKHYDEAAGKYQEAIRIDPGYPAAYNNFGNALLDQERFDEAIEQYRKADELWQKTGSKDRKFALSNWADALRLQKHYEQAAEKYREAIGIDSEYPDAYNGLGAVLADQERFDEAIEQYRKADELWQKTR